MTEPTPAGWYPDPHNSGQQRYWDGTAWTENFAPGTTAGPPTTDAATKPLYKRTWFIVVAALIGLAVIGNIFGGSPSTAPDPTPTATEIAPPTVDAEPTPATAEPEPEPEPVVTEPEPEPEPDLTMGQQQAVDKGQAYLDMAGFSRKGLIEQLVFEGFGKAEAKFAADYIDPNWKEEAAEKAQAYIDMSSFSRKGLIDQLVFEGFTKAQAEYGAKAVGY